MLHITHVLWTLLVNFQYHPLLTTDYHSENG